MAPILLFVYKRPEHTLRTLTALSANEGAEDCDLIVFCDGPRDEKDIGPVNAVRELVSRAQGFRSVKIIQRQQNFGLAKSIISGVSETMRWCEEAIILEDDLVTSRFFLRYMNDALDRYRDDKRVASIHGYVPPVSKELPETFFIRGADCWGWATWRRGWELFNPDGLSLLQELEKRELSHEFDFGGANPFTQMLRDQIAGKNDSWAIRWYASAFLAGSVTLYPGQSLVENIGFDGSGTHCRSSTGFHSRLKDTPVNVCRIPVSDCNVAREAIARFFRGESSVSQPPGILSRVLRRLGVIW